MSERLNLQANQLTTLLKTMMKNLRKELYQKMAGLNREMSQRNEEVRTLLTAEDFATLKLCKQQETDYAKRKLRDHYHGRRRWIKQKTRERRVRDLPKEIDGILMEDQELDGRFKASVRRYGGVTLDDDETEALKLQPNFAIYEEVDELNF